MVSCELLNVPTLLQQANPRGPEFSTTYKNTEQTIKVKFTALEVLLHQEAILSIMAFAQNLVPPPKPAQETVVAETTGAGDAKKTTKPEDAAAVARREEIAAQRRKWALVWEYYTWGFVDLVGLLGLQKHR